MPSVTKVKSCGRRKVYWLQAHGEVVHREPLAKSANYDHNKVYELLPKVKSLKSLARCKVRCVSDGMKVKKASTFGTSPPRKFYPYKDIQRFYSFNDFPNLLVLGCSDPESRNRYYEIFKFEDSQVQELCDLIDKAHSHPLCLLVDDDSSLVRYHSSQSSLASDTEKKSETAEVQVFESVQAENPDTQNIEEGPEEEEVMVEGMQMLETCAEEPSEDQASLISREESPVEAINLNPVGVSRGPEVDDSKREKPHKCQIPEHLRGDPLFDSLCKNVREDDLWAIDMKYINAHPEFGNQIAPNGAVYLFVAHHKYPEISNLQTNFAMENHISGEEYGTNTIETEFTTRFVKN